MIKVQDNPGGSFYAMTSDGTRGKEEGNAYFKDRNFRDAIRCYSRSINDSPTAAAYGNRAMAYLKLNKFIEAEGLYRFPSFPMDPKTRYSLVVDNDRTKQNDS